MVKNKKGDKIINKTALNGSRNTDPYVKNNFKSTLEIQKTFKKIYNPINTTFTIDNRI